MILVNNGYVRFREIVMYFFYIILFFTNIFIYLFESTNLSTKPSIRIAEIYLLSDILWIEISGRNQAYQANILNPDIGFCIRQLCTHTRIGAARAYSKFQLQITRE